MICSSVIGALLGLVAGYSSPRISNAIMRLADVIMSFPSLLLAVIVLYMLAPSVGNIIIVLAIILLGGNPLGGGTSGGGQGGGSTGAENSGNENAGPGGGNGGGNGNGGRP